MHQSVHSPRNLVYADCMQGLLSIFVDMEFTDEPKNRKSIEERQLRGQLNTMDKDSKCDAVLNISCWHSACVHTSVACLNPTYLLGDPRNDLSSIYIRYPKHNLV